ncbi:VOC family protein [Marinomonas mediterranea]|uniref:VOC family protein n=1 Tax=Marinomonas mediterranea TaxID=119864 RepID=UPI00234C00A7|nr:VOC family protein [Marinomonas mediterranea]WCN10895.1 hypothetical protein GV055_19165 [Marinomonas mediterranea]
MSQLNCFVLYAESINQSVALYTQLIGLPPVDQSPNFAMFRTNEGLMLGIWQKDQVRPELDKIGCGMEIVFAVESPAQLEQELGKYESLNLSILNPIVEMDFGYSFTALDSDGHRLRVMCQK